jgi:hypothetical protein
MTNASIQVVDCPIPTDGANKGIALENVQTLILQATVHEVWISYSEEGLSQPYSRFKVSKYINNDGSGDSALVINFPHEPYTGFLYIASAHATDDAKVAIWQIQCGKGRY